MPSFFTSPTVAQQIEKEITNEAKKEQKELKHVISDLRHIETRDAKAHKNVDKLEKALEKNERKEQKLLKELHKATQAYEQAKMNTVHLTEQLQVQRKEAEHVRQELQLKKTSVDSVMTEKEANEQARLARLQEAKRYGSPHSREGTMTHSRTGTMTDAEQTTSPIDGRGSSIRSHGTHRTQGTQGSIVEAPAQPQTLPPGDYPAGQFPAENAPALPARPNPID
ncbi:hypothetical protein BKA70DRAFT_1258533 [Coprinopsis sp. MPI-PUGE-AT-0042]|nr:hypothetical protein BKA70DRAFT_1258533 [Coprinopsis sp. MPI-PUGE-AT-0042]